MNILSKMKNTRVLLLMLMDIVLVNLAYFTAIFYRYDGPILTTALKTYKTEMIVVTIIYMIFFVIFKLYDSLWRYADMEEVFLAIGGCFVSDIFSTIYMLLSNKPMQFSISALAGIFTVAYVVGLRVSYRLFRRVVLDFRNKKMYKMKKVLILGAGAAGSMIIKEMKRKPELRYLPVAVIDDDKKVLGSRVAGVKVVGDRTSIVEVARENAVDEIIIAIPSLKPEEKRELIDICRETACKIKLIPGIFELIEGKVSMKQIKEVDVEDLLGRDPITLDSQGIEEYIKGKTILVTGGGGSIGSELCRQIARFNPKKLLILDIYENNAYDLQNELRDSFPELDLRVIIASVRDKKRMEKTFEEFKPEVVFHAAAHKHVPLMEDNPTEAIKNNVFGTLNVSECADKYGVEKFVLISTDKAVNPTNVMGASKRACEMVIQAMDKVSKTEFAAVRFGNVLGSNGSVIPLFKKQIAQGGPVTLTHKDITRFFMTIPEASQLVLQAGAYAEGGEIFVLDMGKPVKIYDLACDLIKLTGYEPEKDIKIKVTGLRPGEKLYEELLMDEEGLAHTKHEKIFIGRPLGSDIKALKNTFADMADIMENGSNEQLVTKIEELVPTYHRQK